MVKRICPICGMVWYSASTDSEDWPCTCGASIRKEDECELDSVEMQGE